jgi:hypothetical protein
MTEREKFGAYSSSSAKQRSANGSRSASQPDWRSA